MTEAFRHHVLDGCASGLVPDRALVRADFKADKTGFPSDPSAIAIAAARMQAAPADRAMQIAAGLRPCLESFGRSLWVETKSADGRCRMGRIAPPPPQTLIAACPDLRILFLAHGSGYLRQAALDSIRVRDLSPFVLALVFWRVNDWVAEVRAAADQCLSRVAVGLDRATLRPLIPILALRVQSWQRMRAGGTIAGPLAAPSPIGLPPILLDGPGRAALLSYLLETRTGPVPRVMRRAIVEPALDPDLPRIAREAHLGAVRAIAWRALLTGRAQWQTGMQKQWIDKTMDRYRMVPRLAERPVPVTQGRGELILGALRDRFARVRALGVDAMIEGVIPAVAHPLLPGLRKDPSPAVRGRVGFLDRKHAESS